MDPSQLLTDHGPTGVLVGVILVFVRQMLAGGGGLRLVVRHDEQQMKKLGETIGLSAGKVVGERLAAVEAQAERNAEKVAAVRESLTELTVRVDERTKRRHATSHRPDPAKA